jgi:hypothetical protein
MEAIIGHARRNTWKVHLRKRSVEMEGLKTLFSTGQEKQQTKKYKFK